MKKLQSLILILLPFLVQAQEPEYVQVFFENSQMQESWFHSEVSYQGDSYVLNRNGKLPVNEKEFFTPGNSLELKYTSAPGGAWEVDLEFPQWRGKDHILRGTELSLWLYIADKTKKEDLPKLALVLGDSTESQAVSLGKYIDDYGSKQWLQVRVPLNDFKDEGAFNFNHPEQITFVTLNQGSDDGKEHRLFLDQVEIVPAKSSSEVLEAPVLTSATGYERHVDLRWEDLKSEQVRYVKIFRAEGNGEFEPVGIQDPEYFSLYTDFTGEPEQTYSYKISLLDRNYNESPFSETITTATRTMTDEELLDMVQKAHFRYYWEGAEPNSGLALENIPGRSNMIATGASGFGMMALIVGAERGFIERSEFVERMDKILSFIENGDSFHGALSHFMDGTTGKVESFFGNVDNGGDLVETSFFMQGLLTVRQYLDEKTPEEKALRERITSIWEDVEWDWYKQFEDSDYLYWHWSPDHKWEINHRLIGWNETLITYFLALASPTHAVAPEMYYSGWASQDTLAQNYRSAWGQTMDGHLYANGETYHGVKLDVGVGKGGPAFFIHYSFLGLDPNKLEDKYTNYFENNRNIALINYRYSQENPNNFPEYGESWGLTASDGPWGYKAREPRPGMDDGTIAPTGALASFPYLPEKAMTALKHYYRDYGSFLWGEYGFRDAFNLSEEWVAPIYMGLNQAPIVVMIENHRSGLLWELFMKNREIQEGLEKIETLKEKRTN